MANQFRPQSSSVNYSLPDAPPGCILPHLQDVVEPILREHQAYLQRIRGTSGPLIYSPGVVPSVYGSVYNAQTSTSLYKPTLSNDRPLNNRSASSSILKNDAILSFSSPSPSSHFISSSGTAPNKNATTNGTNSISPSSWGRVTPRVTNMAFTNSDTPSTSVVPSQNFATPLTVYDNATARHLSGLLQNEIRSLLHASSEKTVPLHSIHSLNNNNLTLHQNTALIHNNNNNNNNNNNKTNNVPLNSNGVVNSKANRKLLTETTPRYSSTSDPSFSQTNANMNDSVNYTKLNGTTLSSHLNSSKQISVNCSLIQTTTTKSVADINNGQTEVNNDLNNLVAVACLESTATVPERRPNVNNTNHKSNLIENLINASAEISQMGPEMFEEWGHSCKKRPLQTDDEMTCESARHFVKKAKIN
jgi:hypothetical protein